MHSHVVQKAHAIAADMRGCVGEHRAANFVDSPSVSPVRGQLALPSPAVMNDDRCSVVMWRGSEPIRCELPAGHDGTHSGRDGRFYIDWETGATVDGDQGIAYSRGPSEDEQRASYADIAVDRCLYCRTRDFETAFIFVQPAGLKVAVPGRVGLCAICHRFLRNGDFQAVLERTRGTSLNDFPDDAVLDLIRASQAAVPA